MKIMSNFTFSEVEFVIYVLDQVNSGERVVVGLDSVEIENGLNEIVERCQEGQGFKRR